MRHFRRTRDDRGAAAVEFALILPLFIVLVFGVISGGIVFNDKLSIAQGVREAARYGATLPAGPTDVASATTFLTTIRTTAQGDAYGQIGTGAAAYCIGFIPASSTGTSYYLADGASTAASYTPSSSTTPCGSGWLVPPTTAQSVWVIGQKPAALNLMVYSYNTTIGSVAVARFEGS